MLILLLDDDDFTLIPMKTYLSPLGFEVMTGKTPEAGQRLIDRYSFDCVVADQGMGDLTDSRRDRFTVAQMVEFCRAYSPETRIIIASGQDFMAPEIRRAGANLFLMKPVNLDVLTFELKKGRLTKEESENPEFRFYPNHPESGDHF